MLLNNRTEFIKYFDNLLIENGIREICRKCNEGEFQDSDDCYGCCSSCKYLGTNGCLKPNTSCLMWLCPLIKKMNPSIFIYFSFVQLDSRYSYNHRKDADIKFPIEIHKFDSSIDWKKMYNDKRIEDGTSAVHLF